MENDTVVLAFWWGYYRKLGGRFGKTKSQSGSYWEAYQPQKVLLFGAISTPDMEGHFSSMLASFWNWQGRFKRADSAPKSATVGAVSTPEIEGRFSSILATFRN
jgi:hypothetical protein